MSSHIPAIITITTAVLGLVGAYLKLRPRRFVSWLAAVKERETLLAMLDNETHWRTYWQAEAEQCHQEAGRLRAALSVIGDATKNG